MSDHDAIDRRILAVIQSEFPLRARPYQALAEEVGITEEEAHCRVTALRESGLVRRIGGFVDSGRLGLTGTLVAMKVPPERIDATAAVVNAFDGVTHNYLRDHEYNMWFTLAAESEDALRDILEQIKRDTGIDDILDLPSLRRFKINVRLDIT